MAGNGGAKRGGSSSGGATRTRENKATAPELNPEESQMWSEDPSIYQRLADPRRMDSAAEELDEDGYSLEEIQELQDLAFKIRDMSESQTVPGVTTLYRGEQFSSIEKARAKYSVGSEVSTTQLTSYATDIGVAKAYSKQGLSKSSPEVSVVITNTSKLGDFTGVRLQHQGEKPGQGVEVITPKGLKSRVKSTKYDKSTNTLFVEMENFETPKRAKKK